jgi:hypothetical protein
LSGTLDRRGRRQSDERAQRASNETEARRLRAFMIVSPFVPIDEIADLEARYPRSPRETLTRTVSELSGWLP